MKPHNAFAVATVAVLGLIAAAAMGVLANEISGDSIGISAQPLRAGRDLAPPAAAADHKPRHRGAGNDQQGPPATTPTELPTTTTVPATTTEIEPGDDSGSSSSSGSDSSGSGSSGSSGSDD